MGFKRTILLDKSGMSPERCWLFHWQNRFLIDWHLKKKNDVLSQALKKCMDVLITISMNMHLESRLNFYLKQTIQIVKFVLIVLQG